MNNVVLKGKLGAGFNDDRYTLPKDGNPGDILVKTETGSAWEKHEPAEAESARERAEAARVSAENSRAEAESARERAEAGRVNAENGRDAAEQGRVAAENERKTAFDGYQGEIYEIKGDLTKVSESIVEISDDAMKLKNKFEHSRNIADLNNKTVSVTDVAGENRNGTLVFEENGISFHTSDILNRTIIWIKLEVVPSNAYTVSWDELTAGSTFRLYNSARNAYIDIANEEQIITFPNDNVQYLRLNYANTITDISIQKLQFEKGLRTPYENPKTIGKLKDEYFSGKSIVAIGDSIMIGVDTGRGGFLKLLKEKYDGLEIFNYGVGSTSIARNDNITANKNHKCIYDRIDKIAEAPDYIVLEGGLNDYYHGIPIGNVATGYPISAAFNSQSGTWYGVEIEGGSSTETLLDVTTFSGALEASLTKIITKYSTKKYGYIIPHNPMSIPQIDIYMDRAKEICKKYEFPCLDLREYSTMLSKIVSIREKFFVYRGSDGTQNDTTHPNENGYRYRYLPFIESWLKTL